MAVPQFATPAKPPRPGIVSAAASLQFAVLGWGVIVAIFSFLVVRAYADVIADAYIDAGAPNTDAHELANAMVIAMAAVSFCLLIWPGTVALLAIWILKGVNGVRVTTWVLAGIAIVCNLFSVLASGLQTSLATSGNSTDGGDWTTSVQVEELLPGWYSTATIISTVISTAMYIAIVILLLLPKAHEYFRKPVQTILQPVYVPYAAGTPYNPQPGTPYTPPLDMQPYTPEQPTQQPYAPEQPSQPSQPEPPQQPQGPESPPEQR